MANFFDQFDAPAAPVSAPAGGNFFDQFDAPAVAAAPSPAAPTLPPDDLSAGLAGSDPMGGGASETPAQLAAPAIAALDGAANAVPFTDRAAAAAAAATGLGGKFGDYAGNLAQLHAEEGGAMAAHPDAALAGGIVGGALLPVPALGVVADGATLGAKAIRGMAAGGLIGGAQGASSSSDLTDVGQTAKDAGTGAGLGAIAGAAVPLVASGYGAGMRLVQGDVVPAVPGVSNAARDTFLSAIAKDGPDAVQGNAALYGDPAMMFDYGPSLKGVAQGLATKDGPAAATVGDALGLRQAATNSRVRQGLVDNFGVATSPQSFGDGLDAERGATAAQLPSIFANAGPVDISDALNRLAAGMTKAGTGEGAALQDAQGILTRPAPPPATPQPSGGPLPDPTAGLGVNPNPVPGGVPALGAQPFDGSTTLSSWMTSAPPRPTGPAPQSLVTFLQRNGGVQDPGGDLASMGFDRFPGLIRQNGVPLDRAREAAAEAGYLGGDTTAAVANTGVNDLLDTIGNHPSYSVHDEDAVAARNAYQAWQNSPAPTTPEASAASDIRSHLLDSGVPESAIDPATLSAAAHLNVHAGMPVEDAYERAAMAPPFPGDTALPAPSQPAPGPDRVPISNAAQVYNARKDLDARINWQPGSGLEPPPSAVRDANGAYVGARNAVSDALKDQVPGYGEAMDTLHNAFQRGDAFNYGRTSLAGGSEPVWPSDFRRAYGAQAETPGAQDATRLGQRSLMEEAVGTKPNDQLAIKGLFQTGNTPGYTAPGVTPGNPDLSGWNAQKIAAAYGQQPVAKMQELLNANDAFHDTFQGVTQNSATARRQAMVKALEDAEWQPRDLMAEGHGDDTLLGLGRSVLAKGVNAVGHAFQAAPSNVARDADLARVGTITGQNRADMMANLLERLPAYQNREAIGDAARRQALVMGALLAGGGASGLQGPPGVPSSVLAAELRRQAAGGQR